MKWSWKVGRFAGIDVFIHWTFTLLLLWIAGMHLLAGESVAAAAYGLSLVIAFFACILLHEFGHALTARRYGVGTRDITLLPIGGVARLQRMPEEPWQEFWIALAGPAVNVAIAAVVGAILWIQGQLWNIQWRDMLGGTFLQGLLVFNILVVLFNMLPAFPMDGGRVLRSLLATRTSYVRATLMAATVGQAMAILFGLVGLLSMHPLLIFIALFVYLGAEAEAQLAQFKASTSNVPVREAMMTVFRSLSPQDSLEVAARELLAGAQQDFPVVDEDGQVRGVLCRKDLMRGLAEEGAQMRVGDVMSTDFTTLDAHEMLDAVLARMQQDGCASLPVLDRGRLAGLLTMENAGELIMIRTAVRGDPQRSEDPEQLVGSP